MAFADGCQPCFAGVRKHKPDVRMWFQIDHSPTKSCRRRVPGHGCGRFNIALNTAMRLRFDFRMQKCGSVPRGNQNEQKRP